MEYIASMPGFFKPVLNTSQQRSSGQYLRRSVSLAALRAFTGAEIHRANPELTLREIALRVGCSVPYLRAAITLLEYGDQALITRVLRRDCMILAAAASVAVLVKLLTVLEAASPAIRTKAAGRIGVDRIWDTMIAPVVT